MSSSILPLVPFILGISLGNLILFDLVPTELNTNKISIQHKQGERPLPGKRWMRPYEGSFPLNRFIPSLRRLRVPAVQRCYQSRKVSQVILPSLDKAPLIAPRHLVRTHSVFRNSGFYNSILPFRRQSTRDTHAISARIPSILLHESIFLRVP